VIIFLLGIILLAWKKISLSSYRVVLAMTIITGIWFLFTFIFGGTRIPLASLQIGLLDPIALVSRSVNLTLLPLIDGALLKFSASTRYYVGAGVIGSIFLIAVLLNLKIPRFYCRFICPLGALFGVLGRFALWRIGKRQAECLDCHICEANCEGACEPSSQIRISECVLCMNCLNECRHGLMTYQTTVSAAGEITTPDVSRREFVISLVAGVAAVPLFRLSGNVGPNWNPGLIRPPGALAEHEFLSRCIKCGQCMRICPTNVIHPAGLDAGLEGIWTPKLNFRVGTSGCQFNCIACGNICPTAAIRPLILDERLGSNQYAEQGPIKIGTAFVDRGRCLPWAMDRPCIVCQENCPVSPKAIFTREEFNTIRTYGALIVKTAGPSSIEFTETVLVPDQVSTGDYYCKVEGQTDDPTRLIVKNTAGGLSVSPELPFDSLPLPGSRVEIQIRLQRPYVDPERCIGCGVCEHECPVKGKAAIRVSAENESRNRAHKLLL
jgi:ferredoxin